MRITESNRNLTAKTTLALEPTSIELNDAEPTSIKLNFPSGNSIKATKCACKPSVFRNPFGFLKQSLWVELIAEIFIMLRVSLEFEISKLAVSLNYTVRSRIMMWTEHRTRSQGVFPP